MTEPLYLIDSNIVIYILQDGHCHAARRLQDCTVGSAVTSAIVYGEVMRGIIRREPERAAMASRFFDVVTVLPYDRHAASAYAELPFKRGSFDRLIAAHAMALDITLVTNNEGDFADIPGLRVENWTV